MTHIIYTGTYLPAMRQGGSPPPYTLHHIPALTTTLLTPQQELLTALHAATSSPFSLIFASRHAINSVEKLHLDMRRLTHCYCVGEKTRAHAITTLGIAPELVLTPDAGMQNYRGLITLLKTRRITTPLIIPSLKGTHRPFLADLGLEPEAILQFDAYSTDPTPDLEYRLGAKFKSHHIDFIAFSSPKAVRIYAPVVKHHSHSPALASIGPTTSKAMEEANLKSVHEASVPDLHTLFEELHLLYDT